MVRDVRVMYCRPGEDPWAVSTVRPQRHSRSGMKNKCLNRHECLGSIQKMLEVCLPLKSDRQLNAIK